nr:antibiotic biosynthesis monooxygenase [Streptococcus gallolyticus]
MSFTVNIYYEGVNGSTKKFIEEMNSLGIVDAIRSESGNLRYDYSFLVSNPEIVVFIDSWESQESFKAHYTSSKMASVVALCEKYNLHMRAERYSSVDE